MSKYDNIMPIDNITDWQMRLQRQDAFWNCEIIDRPVMNMAISKPDPNYPWPNKEYTNMKEKWLDFDTRAEQAVAGVMNTEYLGDSLPNAVPNLGPEVFSAFFGCDMDFSEGTTWSIPNLLDWADVDKIKFTEDNFYWKKIEEFTDKLLEVGKGKFYTGITDIHPGGDAIAAFRDPLEFNIDMIDYTDEVKQILNYVNEIYCRVMTHYCDKLQKNNQAISSWYGITSSKRHYAPSNDFSCMVSKKMFDDVFLPGIITECKHNEASIYHLDGPNALQHLDSLLEIKELNAIQWVYGAGNGRASDWMPVYKKCQAAGKGLQIGLGIDEIDYFMSELKPNGLWLSTGVDSKETADAVIKKMLAWK
ncbi:MAG: hypothetical protein WCO98_11260 [bacterium]